MRRCRRAVAGLLTAFAIFIPATSHAAGFGISPAFQQVEIKAGQATSEYELQLSNPTAYDQSFRLSVVDFGSLDESGGVAFLGTPASELEHRYGLASWMTLGTNQVFVARGASVPVSVTIDNRASLAPGGHYGAVLATAVTDTGNSATGNSRVNVRQVLSSLVLVTKDGGLLTNLKLVSQTTNHAWLRLPSSSEQRFQNTGNVHVVPRGVVEVRDPLGHVVVRGALNDGSEVILPESFRRYVTPLIHVATAWLPGRYNIVTTYRFDGTDATSTYTSHIWYAGLAIVWIMAIVATCAIGLFGWWLLRRHKRS